MRTVISAFRAHHIPAVVGGAALLLVGLHGSGMAQDDDGMAAAPAAAAAAKKSKSLKFSMVLSTAASAAHCATGAKASVTITQSGSIGQKLAIKASGLPKKTGFDLFVIQIPNAPFGLAWYQGDLETDGSGKASGTFVSIFSDETFGISLGAVPAPQTHTAAPFPDATVSPTFAPVHTYHLGLWFDSTSGAAAAGCPSTETPFNGDHTAGIQVLSTKNFADLKGPLLGFPPQ